MVNMQCRALNFSNTVNYCYFRYIWAKEGGTGSLPWSVQWWQQAASTSLREAAREQAPWNQFVANACKCTTGCVTQKCHCMKQGIN